MSALPTTARAAAAPDREFAYSGEDFRAIANLLEQQAGIHLPEHKDQLVYSRLAKRLRALNLSSFAEYRAFLQSPAGQAELQAMVNALTTNLTRFFREGHHFDHLASHLRELAAKGGQRRLRIWSAGCSTGMEPYSIAAVVAEALPQRESWDARILATDIDTDVLATARRGFYQKTDASEIPPAYRKHFAASGGGVQVSEALGQLIAFKPLNLMGAWPMKGPFDIVFCRNVAIYFTQATQTRMFTRMGELLTADGRLYIGHSETLTQLSDRFDLVGQTVYRPRAR